MPQSPLDPAAPTGDGELSELAGSRIPPSLLRPILEIAGDTGIRAAAATMFAAGGDCLLVPGPEGSGIVTRTDLIQAWAVDQKADDAPVASLARRPLISLEAEASLFMAMVAMAEHRVARVVICDDAGQPRGLLNLEQVLAHLSDHSGLMGLRIERADSVEQLQRAAASADALVRSLLDRGIRMRVLMDLMAALNDRIIARLYELLMPAEVQAHTALLVLGSEGRGEQILKTDQDNALIIAPGFAHRELASLCQRFSEHLLGLGYPPCPGGIMISNPEWRGEPATWLGRIDTWQRQRSEAALMNLAIFSDARVIAGQRTLHASLGDPIGRLREQEQFFHHFARPVLRFPTPLNLFGQVRRTALDLKKGGIFPLVHGLRCLALQHGIEERNSFRRIDALAAAGRLDGQRATELASALEVLCSLRIRAQLAGGDDQLEVSGLGQIDRDLLRDALRIVNGFKDLLTRAFHLNY